VCRFSVDIASCTQELYPDIFMIDQSQADVSPLEFSFDLTVRILCAFSVYVKLHGDGSGTPFQHQGRLIKGGGQFARNIVLLFN
jgi:hypothetical protein